MRGCDLLDDEKNTGARLVRMEKMLDNIFLINVVSVHLHNNVAPIDHFRI